MRRKHLAQKYFGRMPRPTGLTGNRCAQASSRHGQSQGEQWFVAIGILVLGLVVAFGISRLGGCARTVQKDAADLAVRRQAMLTQRLAYLTEDVAEIEWVEVESNDVYIGFREVPKDMDLILRFAAVHGSNAINYGVHVWAVPSQSRGWRPGGGFYYAEITARNGKVER